MTSWRLLNESVGEKLVCRNISLCFCHKSFVVWLLVFVYVCVQNFADNAAIVVSLLERTTQSTDRQLRILWTLAKIAPLLYNVSKFRHNAVSELESSFIDKLLHPKCTKELRHRSFLSPAVRLIPTDSTSFYIPVGICTVWIILNNISGGIAHLRYFHSFHFSSL